ncbi:MAG: anti-sigma factor, partial [Actinomycetes bacterium]
LTGVYAVNALDGDERTEFEQHLASCPACQSEVRELQATAARLGDAEEVVPPSAMKAAVLAAIRQTRQLPPVVGGQAGAGERSGGQAGAAERDGAHGAADDARGTSAAGADASVTPTAVVVPLDRRRRSWWRSPLTAAAAALVILAGGEGIALVGQHQQLDQQQAIAASISRVLAAPDHTVRTADVTGGGQASVIAANGEAVVLASDLAGLASDKTYQLWVIRDGQARSVGLLGTGSGMTSTLVRDVRSGDAVGVTVEPAGGSRQPTTTPVVVLQA